MLTKKTRRIAVVALIAGVVVLARAWPDSTSRDVAVARISPSGVRHAASADSPRNVGMPIAPTAAPDGPDSTSAARSTPDVDVGRTAKQAPVRLEVRAPSDVRTGDVFQVRVDIDARAAVRDLMFSIAYEKSRLNLVGRSYGEFVRQPGVPSDFGVDEPSEGYIHVIFRARNGSSASGAGTIAVFEFEAIRLGTSVIELQNVKTNDAGGNANPNVIVVQDRVAIH